MRFYALKSQVMVWLENGKQKHNRCGITDGIGAEYMLYLQDHLIWTYTYLDEYAQLLSHLSSVDILWAPHRPFRRSRARFWLPGVDLGRISRFLRF